MPKSKEIETVESAVLGVYQAVNPSTYHIDRSSEDFRYREDMRIRLFRDNLNFPIQMFRDAKFLDFGTGTGDHSVFFSRWGARSTLVEMNPKALERARALYEKFAPDGAEYRFIESSLFDVELDEQFDIVLSEGVLHHTADKAAGFDKLVSYLKDGGYAVLGIATTAGQFQRNLQRMILYRFCDSADDIENLAERLFKEHIDRAAKFGRRDKRAVIYDTYVNPKYDTPTVREILQWFNKNNIRFYSSWPRIIPIELADSGGNASYERIRSIEAISAIPELYWLSHNSDDSAFLANYAAQADTLNQALEPFTKSMADVTPEQDFDLSLARHNCETLVDHIVQNGLHVTAGHPIVDLLREIAGLIKVTETGNVDELAQYIQQCQSLFRGPAGMGLSYFIGYKPEQP